MRNRDKVKQKALKLLISGLDATELSMVQISVTLSAEDKRNEEIQKQAYKEVAIEEIKQQKLEKLQKEQEHLVVLCAYVGVETIPSNEFTQSVAKWLQTNGTITEKQEQAIRTTVDKLKHN